MGSTVVLCSVCDKYVDLEIVHYSVCGDCMTKWKEPQVEIERLRAENGSLSDANKAYRAQMICVGIVPYLDRIKEQQAEIERLQKRLAEEKQCYAEVKEAQQDAELQIERLRADLNDSLELLRELHDLQNGPPLPKYVKDWKAAIRAIEKMLDDHGK